MADLVRQIRVAVRSLARTPVVSAAAVISLALGLGATTAVFSAVSAALMDGMPFAEPQTLVSVFRTTPHFRNGPFSTANFLDLREQTETIESLGAVGYGTALLKRSERTYQVSARPLSPDLFATLGVAARHGRLLQADDERADATAVAVLSDEVFRSRFGADPAIVGQTIVLDGLECRAFVIITIGESDQRVFGCFACWRGFVINGCEVTVSCATRDLVGLLLQAIVISHPRVMRLTQRNCGLAGDHPDEVEV